MKRNSRSVVILMVGISILFFCIEPTQPQSLNPQDTMNQYIAELQKKPNDYSLRVRIINFAREMKPAPEIPAEADKSSARAESIFKNAKTLTDYVSAAREYEKALLKAPWVADYYYNLGFIYEKAVKPQEAKTNYEYYLLAMPKASDAREVRERIAKLETEIKPGGNDKKTDEMLVLMSQKSTVGAWAMSFFIGLFTPVLGSGQYFAESYGTAAVTTILGLGSYGILLGGVIPEKNANEGRVKQKQKLVIAGSVIFSAVWIFDWIYAPIATKKYNEKVKAKFSSIEGSVIPLISYSPTVSCMTSDLDHVFKLGLSMRF